MEKPNSTTPAQQHFPSFLGVSACSLMASTLDRSPIVGPSSPPEARALAETIVYISVMRVSGSIYYATHATWRGILAGGWGSCNWHGCVPVRMFWNASSTLLASNADVSMNERWLSAVRLVVSEDISCKTQTQCLGKATDQQSPWPLQ